MATLPFLYAEQAALVALGGGQTEVQFVATQTNPLAPAAYLQAVADANFFLSWGGALNRIVLQIEGLLGKPLPPPGGQFPINGRR